MNALKALSCKNSSPEIGVRAASDKEADALCPDRLCEMRFLISLTAVKFAGLLRPPKYGAPSCEMGAPASLVCNLKNKLSAANCCLVERNGALARRNKVWKATPKSFSGDLFKKSAAVSHSDPYVHSCVAGPVPKKTAAGWRNATHDYRSPANIGRRRRPRAPGNVPLAASASPANGR